MSVTPQQPTNIQKNRQPTSNGSLVSCAFTLTDPHRVVVAIDMQVNLTLSLLVDGKQALSTQMRWPFYIKSGEHAFELEGVPCQFIYRFRFLRKQAKLIVGDREIMKWAYLYWGVGFLDDDPKIGVP